MSKQLTYALIVIIITLGFGCKKNGSKICNNIQLPGEYFPAFPKSWWNYRTQTNTLIKYEISRNYSDCFYKCRPVFINLNKCVAGCSFLQQYYSGQGQVSLMESPIYSLTLDSILFCPISFATFKQWDTFMQTQEVPFRRVTVVMDTSITLQNSKKYENVIVVKEYNIYHPSHRYFDYFAKHIGLIKRDSVNVNDTTKVIQILYLENYYIGI